MNEHTSPEAFLTAFRAVAGQSADLANVWNAPLSIYTNFMRGTVLVQVAERLILDYYPGDYYTLDAIMYSTRDLANFSPRTTYAHSIAVALEHENNAHGSMVEVNKLQLFNTPLKVLITYPDSSAHGSKLLNQYVEAMTSADLFADFSNKRRKLVIFGYRRGRQSNPEWHGYQYVNKNFEEIK